MAERRLPSSVARCILEDTEGNEGWIAWRDKVVARSRPSSHRERYRRAGGKVIHTSNLLHPNQPQPRRLTFRIWTGLREQWPRRSKPRSNSLLATAPRWCA